MLEIQKFLRTDLNHLTGHENNFLVLEKEYGIYAKQHPEYHELFQMSYDQIDTPSSLRNHPMVMESRGLILNSANNWEVVAYPFNRFFNIKEQQAAKIDWSSASVFSKIDGSLVILYFYDNKWQVATRNSPNASGSVGNNPFTFNELIWNCIEKQGIIHKLSLPIFDNCTLMFELTSPYNRVVVNHTDDTKLTFIGARNNKTLKEYSVNDFKFIDGDTGEIVSMFETVQQYPFTTLEEVNQAIKEMDGSQEEGFCIVDKNFNKVKLNCVKMIQSLD